MVQIKGNDTYGPVPVRLDSAVVTFVHERILEKLNVVSVPWEEKAGKVDLSCMLTGRDGQGTQRLDERQYSSPCGRIRYLRYL